MERMQTDPVQITEKNEQAIKQKKKLNPIKRNIIISCALLAFTIVSLLVWLQFRPNNKTDIHDYFSAEMVGELTTLECRYHNVSVLDKEGGFLGVGKKYVWFEYDVIVDVGIDVNQVRIEDPTDDGVVKVYLPPAKILGAKEDMATISKPVCDDSLFAEITADDERQIINEGVQRLINDAKTKEVINQAQESAKDVLEQYITNIGELIGEDYRVEWLKASDNNQNAPADQTDSAAE